MCCASKEVGKHCLTICSLITKRNSFNIFFYFLTTSQDWKSWQIFLSLFFFTERSFCEAPGSAAQLPAYRPFHVQSEFLFAVTFSLFLYDKNNKSKKKTKNKKTTLSPSAATILFPATFCLCKLLPSAPVCPLPSRGVQVWCCFSCS